MNEPLVFQPPWPRLEAQWQLLLRQGPFHRTLDRLVWAHLRDAGGHLSWLVLLLIRLWWKIMVHMFATKQLQQAKEKTRWQTYFSLGSDTDPLFVGHIIESEQNQGNKYTNCKRMLFSSYHRKHSITSNHEQTQFFRLVSMPTTFKPWKLRSAVNWDDHESVQFPAFAAK